MNTNYYRNWHKSYGRSVKSELSAMFPVDVNKSVSSIEINFRDDKGRTIRFYLSTQDATKLKNKITESLNKV